MHTATSWRLRDLSSLNFPTIGSIYLQFGGMGKGHGSKPTVSTSHKQILMISPKWKKLFGWVGIRKITLLRWFFTCWYRRVLTPLEAEFFLMLVDDFSKQFPSVYVLQQQLKCNSIQGKTYLQWCESGWRGKFKPGKLDLEDLRWLLVDCCKMLLFDQRASKGLLSNGWFLKRLSYFITIFHSVDYSVKHKKGRKRGHNDHGHLPSNRAAREADRIGGNLENTSLLQNRLLAWLRNLLSP
jgi:hypothetical protein